MRDRKVSRLTNYRHVVVNSLVYDRNENLLTRINLVVKHAIDPANLPCTRFELEGYLRQGVSSLHLVLLYSTVEEVRAAGESHSSRARSLVRLIHALSMAVASGIIRIFFVILLPYEIL